MSDPAREASADVRRQAAFRLWLANLVIAALVGANWLAHLPETPGPRAWLFAVPALVSTALMLTILPGAFFFWLAGRVGTRRLGRLQAAFWTVVQMLLYTDTRIFNMFRYHLNGQVWNLVAVRGSEDSIHLGWQVWLAIAVGLGGGLALELWLWRVALRRAERAQGERGRLAPLRPWILCSVVLLPVVFLEKTIYAHADLARDQQLLHLARLFPLYARVPAEDLASRVLGVEVERPPRVELEGYRLDYPHARPAVDPAGPRPNVLVVMIDCLRSDRLTPRHTPELWRFAQGARRFEDHLSGGNSTRYGLFSFFYGLHGSYWFPVLAERRSPVLVDTLLELGYELGVFSSATMAFPELLDTVWARVRDRVRDDFPAEEAWRRDEQAAAALVRWLEERERQDAPFFAFLLLDSPHQTYSYPPGLAPFQPAAPELDYLSFTKNEGPRPEQLEAVRNRYDNAVHHADRVAGRVLAALDGSLFAEDTLVVVTGDHGEEFRECGFFGHTSAFTPEQVAVPFVMRGPGIEPGVETRPTSHLDFAPTLLELFGANPSGRAAWCLGESLLDPPAERRRVLSGWNELGVWTPAGVLRIPLSLFRFDVEVYDYRWRLVHDDSAALASEAETLERLGAECNRFLR